MTDQICPECEIGQLTATMYSDTFIYNGMNITVHNLQCGICDCCGSDPVSPEQVHLNHQKILAAKAKCANDHPYTMQQLEQAIQGNVYKCFHDCGWVGTLDECDYDLGGTHDGEHQCPYCGAGVCDFLFVHQ